MNQNVINCFFTAASAILASKPTNPVEEELQRSVADLMEDVTLVSLQKNGIDSNLFFMSKDGFCPTKKGWDALFNPDTRIVVKQPNIRKVPHEVLLEKFQEAGREICHRANNWPAFRQVITEEENTNKLYSVIECVTNSIIKANDGCVTNLDAVSL